MIRPIEVQAREDYKIWLSYEDGANGEVDLGHLAGQGVFKAWDAPGYFKTARITEYGSVAWGDTDDIELCPNALYMRLTGKSIDEILPEEEWDEEDAPSVVAV